MRSYIVYETKNKKNEKVAKAAGAALDIPVADIAEKPALEGIDFLFIVSGWYDGNSSGDMLCFLKELKTGAVKHAGIITLAHNYDLNQPQIQTMLTQKGIAFVGERVCMSQFLFLAIGHPNKADINSVVAFIKETLGMPKYE